MCLDDALFLLVSSTVETDTTTLNTVLGVFGSANVGWCWELSVNGRNDSQHCKDVQYIMGRIRTIRLCKLTKFPGSNPIWGLEFF